METSDYFNEALSYHEPEDSEHQERPRDPVIDEARSAVEGYVKRDLTTVYYLKQLQVIFERKFYHWITAKAIGELVAERRLRDSFVPLRAVAGEENAKVRFIFHPKNRYTKRIIQRKIALIRRFSTEPIGRACGRQAEILFSRALLSKGFRQVAESARRYQDSEWTESGHDLDFILERDGLAYGCEIKNRFEYITRDEMRIKIRMCRHLGLIPLFIMRAAAKSYIEEIRQAGGFTKIFETHIFPYGTEDLVQEIRQEFPGLPVDSPRDLPNTILDRLLEWHARRASD